LQRFDVKTVAADLVGPTFCTSARSLLPDDFNPQVTPEAMKPAGAVTLTS
jgi:hypothetical protein